MVEYKDLFNGYSPTGQMQKWETMKMIEKSKEWPENLGVGKLYEFDTRMQDYLLIYCLKKLNRAGETAVLQNSIIDYTNRYYATPSLNHILAIRILEEKGETKVADTFIQKMGESTQQNSVQQWVIANYKGDQAGMDNLEKEFVNHNYFMILKKLTEIKN